MTTRTTSAALASAIGGALPIGIVGGCVAAAQLAGVAPGNAAITLLMFAPLSAVFGWKAFRLSYYGPTLREMMADLAEEVAKLPPECGWQIGQEDADHPAAGMFYADAYFPSDPVSPHGGGVTPAEAMREAREKLEGRR